MVIILYSRVILNRDAALTYLTFGAIPGMDFLFLALQIFLVTQALVAILLFLAKEFAVLIQ